MYHFAYDLQRPDVSVIVDIKFPGQKVNMSSNLVHCYYTYMLKKTQPIISINTRQAADLTIALPDLASLTFYR